MPDNQTTAPGARHGYSAGRMRRVMSDHNAPPKPRHGEPCNGCGLCCAAEVCEIGQMAFPGASAPCPGMLFDEGRFHCKLVLTEQMAGMEPLIARALGIGKGCDADD